MNKKLLLIAIIVLAFFVRFYKLGSYPALNADEAAIGYNAYSLLETGRDEHGNPWPIHFQSFNDYKPGLYVYLVLPFVKVLGLTEWAVRIPNALLGVATVYVLYLLSNELFKDKKFSIGNQRLTLWHLEFGIWPALFLAISPWHIHFSRGGWEVNTSTFFIITGVLFFLKALKNIKFFLLSTLFFILSLYTYHSARVVAPLLGLGLVILYINDLKKLINLKFFLLSSFFFLLLLMPLMKDFMGPAGISRASGVGLFADSGPLSRTNEQRGEHINFGGYSGRLLHNKAVNYSLAFIDNWAKHFHGEFLFLSGDEIQRNRVPETGQMYLFDFVFIIFGFIFILKSLSLNLKSKYLILYWLLIAPFASALTFQSPHALRAQNMVIPLTIISAIGFSFILDWFCKQKIKILKIGNWLLIILVALQFLRYEHMYYTHMSKEYSFSSQYALKELVDYVKENEERFDKVVVTDTYDQPYILFLFYLNYSPEKFQAEHTLGQKDKYGFSTVREFSKFSFQKIDWDSVRDLRNTLLIGVEGDFVRDANITKRIYFPNGQVAFEIVPL